MRQKINSLKKIVQGVVLLSRTELFSYDFYSKKYGPFKTKYSAILNYLVKGAELGYDPSPSFCTKYYLQEHIDVFEEGLNPLVHYIQFGQAEGRAIQSPSLTAPTVSSVDKKYSYPCQIVKNSSLFDIHYYLEKNPDLLAKEVDPIEHFTYVGYKEGRNPSQKFNIEEYYSLNPDVAKVDVNPLYHYEVSGEKIARRYSRNRIGNWKFPFSCLGTKNVLTLPSVLEDEKGSAVSLGVHIHCFYIDVMDSLLERLRNVPFHFSLYVSIPNRKMKRDVERVLSSYSGFKAQVAVVENKGRDLSPMAIAFNKELQQHDLCLHLHTKKSIEKEAFGREWLQDILAKLLFNRSYVRSILKTFKDNPSIGALFPSPYWKIKPFMGWGANRDLAQKFMKRLGFEHSEESLDKLHFPAGSMFWFRPQVIRQFFETQLDYVDFDKEPIPDDGTFAHALERCFGAISELNGFQNFDIDYYPYEKSWPTHLKLKFSVIIPCYNAQEWVGSAIESVLRQRCAHTPFEIICIDNGSTDSTVSIIEMYTSLYPNINLLNEPTKGAGNARNKGLSNARGEYIVFLDADDVLAPDALADFYAAFKRAGKGCDLVASNLSLFDEKDIHGAIPYQDDSFAIGMSNFIECSDLELWPITLQDFGPCAKAYRKDFLIGQNITFPTGVNFEDNVFIYDVYMNLNEYAVIPHLTYYYRKFGTDAGNTQSTIISEESFFDQVQVLESIASKYAEKLFGTKKKVLATRLYAKITWELSRVNEKFIKDCKLPSCPELTRLFDDTKVINKNISIEKALYDQLSQKGVAQ